MIEEKAKLLEGINIGEFLTVLKKAYATIAGGAITSVFTNKDIRDYDIYFYNQRGFDEIKDYLIDKSAGPIYESSNALSFEFCGNKIQLIKPSTLVRGTAQEIISGFDFTMCMGAYSFIADEFVLHDDFLIHNARRILVFNTRARRPMASMLRVLKFRDRGYTISPVELLKLILTINSIWIPTNHDLVDNIRSISPIQLEGFYKELLKDGVRNREYAYDSTIGLLEDFNLSNLIERSTEHETTCIQS